MSQTQELNNAYEVPEIVVPSDEVLGAEMAELSEERPRALASTAIEEIMRTDPVAAFEFPEHVIKAGNDITYTPPSGDQ